MIDIPMITSADMELFRGKKVVIYGIDRGSLEAYQMFIHLGIEVLGVYGAQSIVHFLAKRADGFPCIGFRKLQHLIETEKNLLVQCVDGVSEDELLMLQTMGAQISPFSLEMLRHSFQPVLMLEMLRQTPQKIRQDPLYGTKSDLSKRIGFLHAQRLRKPKNLVIICNPGKTADHTLNGTFDAVNGHQQNRRFRVINKAIGHCVKRKGYQPLAKLLNQVALPLCGYHPKIDYINIFHKPNAFDKQAYSSDQTIKIITAVREPISQNISDLYQGIGSADGYVYKRWITHALANGKDISSVAVQKEFEELFITNGGDGQALFDEMVNKHIYAPLNNFNYGIIQRFIPCFNECVLDIFAYPFNQEKGYTVIKEGNIQVFVYQLEKLNQLVPELSAFIGVHFETLEKGNISADKWIGDSYKQAQKEIVITQEYFARCFDEPYVKHFYSEADIKKFKAKWRPHIQLAHSKNEARDA